MSTYSVMTAAQRVEEYQKLKKEYDSFVAKGLKLDMSRGKPASVQLDLTMGLLGCVADGKALLDETGFDCRNYGLPAGIPEARKLMAGLMEIAPEETIIGGSSSLNMMYDAVSRAMTHGLPGSDKPWSFLPEIKFLCPVPGYDRHFAICEHFGIKMIPIEMDENGPDMDKVEALVSSDASVRGIWCVPKYSNPAGTTYSAETVRRFARLNPAAPDFRIFWDNAYTVHDLSDTTDELANIMEACKKTGREDLVYIFSSTSKISFAGAGLAAMGASQRNVKHILASMSIQTIGHNKINQLAHTRFFGDVDGIKKHMKLHAEILRPKFSLVLDILQAELGELEIAQWHKPRGGYFISLDVPSQCARRTVELCKEAGVVLTPAGATHPYGVDPEDKNIRIAPTFPPEQELQTAAELLCLCVKLASLEEMGANS